MKRIMIVDDSTVMRKNLRSILTKAGYEIVAEATNGVEAYHAYTKFVPDLVTMDVTMPILNGIEAVKRIKHAFPDACIIVISAFDQRSMLFEALEYGAKHYIIKPITADKLLGVVEKVLQGDDLENSKSTRNRLHQEVITEEVLEATPIIANLNGKFVVAIPHGLQSDGLQSIRAALQGLLFIKPLHIEFDFESEKVEASMLDAMDDIILAIERVGGEIRFIARSHQLQQVLRHKYNRIPQTHE